MHAFRTVSVITVLLAFFGRLFAGDSAADRALLDAEETYHLRLERVIRAKGNAGVVERLKVDFASNPRPYVKAWYASYLLYANEYGVPEFSDPKRGFALAKEAQAEGSLYGLELVGRAWGDARGTSFRDTRKALECLKEAASRGSPTAMAELSKYYYFGRGVRVDRQEADQWALKAAWRGSTAGLMNLAEWWDGGVNKAERDPAKANELYYEAAEYGSEGGAKALSERAKAGDPSALKYMYLAFVVGAREGAVAYPVFLKKAVAWLDENAPADDWRVQLALADVMIEKLGAVYSPAKAREKMERAAAAGVDDARAVLAEMAYRGIGQKAEPAKAVAVWRELAEKGNARALNRIGWLSWWGNGAKYGVSKDAATAFDLCRRAADLGYFVAQRNVADCYAHGIGTEKNYYLAAKYYGILDRRGFIEAKRQKDRMLASLDD